MRLIFAFSPGNRRVIGDIPGSCQLNDIKDTLAGHANEHARPTPAHDTLHRNCITFFRLAMKVPK
jgi:hypothetical protein